MRKLIRRAAGLALAMLMLLGAAQAQTLYTVQRAKLYKRTARRPRSWPPWRRGKR